MYEKPVSSGSILGPVLSLSPAAMRQIWYLKTQEAHTDKHTPWPCVSCGFFYEFMLVTRSLINVL